MPKVIFELPLIPSNAQLIAEITALISKTDSVEAPVKKIETVGDSLSIEDMKKLLKAAKTEHGETFINACYSAIGVELKSSVGRTLSSVPKDQYEVLAETLKAGPQNDSDDENDGFDDDGLDDDPIEISAETVQTALKAYAKEAGREEAKKIMTTNGAKSLPEVANCSTAQLAAMMNAMAE